MSNRSFSLRQTLFRRLFDQQTRSGRRFEALCGLLALLSVITIFIESSMGSQLTFMPQEWHLFIWLEIGFTLIFTLEYILRVIAWPSPVRYVFSFWGVIDLATMLPLYVLWLWPELALHYFFAWRAMRAIRVLRILKLLRYMPALHSLWRAVINARHQLILFYAFVGIVMVSAGALMYAIEGEASGFTSLGRGGLLGGGDGNDSWLRRYYAPLGCRTVCGLGADFNWLLGDSDPNGDPDGADEQRTSAEKACPPLSALPSAGS
ncbi:voltage-gated potassium channel [Pseudescherichia vulneris]|nr:voltage-gated potassium channel [Pseudescherichia vulneris]